MTIESWSDDILMLELQDDPSFSDDLTALFEKLEDNPEQDVVLNFQAVTYLNSSNIAKLLRLRKQCISHKRKLVLCCIDTNVWGLFLVTGLDKVFEFADTVATGLAAAQINA